MDRLLSDGQNPTHFAKQLVRFLRNAVVAKVAGGESSLLQISSDERQRVARAAELFSEEDLTRHLQIMLRTHEWAPPGTAVSSGVGLVEDGPCATAASD